MTSHHNKLCMRELCTTAIAVVFLLAPVAVPGTAAAAVRQAKVAGSFYPAEDSQLRQMVRRLLDEAPAPKHPDKPRLLMAPHAGYQYSGKIAASAFRLLQGHRYDAVVVVAFTHRLQFPGASVDDQEAYETPLGAIPVDREAAEFLQSQHPSLKPYAPAHDSAEHSLEVMLPFLQESLGEFRLVPILMGNAQLDQAKILADALAALARRGDYLFVFSTDLSHYHSYGEAVSLDERTVKTILFETPEATDRLFQAGQVEACGQGPIVTAGLLARRLGDLGGRLVAYANSGDTTGDKSRVVGYAAVAYHPRPGPSAPALSEESGRALVTAARRVLDMQLHPAKYANRQVSLGLEGIPELAQASGIFVTLRRNGLLRGCIGRIETARPLAESLPIVTLDAALRDTRFAPVRAEELDGIHVEVSVLSRLTPIASADELVAGRDGVVLEHPEGRGVFLPMVWKETGWTRAEFLRELASEKAGLAPEAWREAQLYVFQDQVFEEGSVPAELIAH